MTTSTDERVWESLVEAADLDHAVRIASDLPEASAPSSGVEIRPLAAP